LIGRKWPYGEALFPTIFVKFFLKKLTTKQYQTGNNKKVKL